jgi:hypothetical protein
MKLKGKAQDKDHNQDGNLKVEGIMHRRNEEHGNKLRRRSLRKAEINGEVG